MKKTYLIIIFLCITFLLQAQVSKTISITAGGLYSALSITERNTITNLTVTGKIDASDFKTMRDNMLELAILDLSGTTIAAYSGNLGTSGSTEFTFSYPANTIPNNAFCKSNGKIKFTSFTFPSSVTSIADFAFWGCSKLTSISIPSSVTSIGIAAFSDCIGLTSISIPSTSTSIAISAFSNCSGLTSFTIPSSVTSIGVMAFSGCSGLTSLSIPASVTSLGTQSFSGCNRLTSIYVYSNIPIVLTPSNSNGTSETIFYLLDKSSCILYVPTGTLNTYRSANQWSDFLNVEEFSTTEVGSINTNELSIYPNPVKDGFRVNGINGLSMLRLLDINGKVLLTKEINNNEYVSVSSLPKGMYFIKITSEGKAMEQKIIKN